MGPSEIPDAILVERIRAGDTRAIEVLIRRYHGLALSLAYHLDRKDWEDDVQWAWINAWRRLPQLRDPARFDHWFFAIVHRCALEGLRRRRNDPLGEPVPETRDSETPERILQQRETAQVLQQTVRAIPGRLRLAFQLVVVEGLPSAEVAKRLELGIEATKARVHRGRLFVRAKLRETGLEAIQ